VQVCRRKRSQFKRTVPQGTEITPSAGFESPGPRCFVSHEFLLPDLAGRHRSSVLEHDTSRKVRRPPIQPGEYRRIWLVKRRSESLGQVMQDPWFAHVNPRLLNRVGETPKCIFSRFRARARATEHRNRLQPADRRDLDGGSECGVESLLPPTVDGLLRFFASSALCRSFRTLVALAVGRNTVPDCAGCYFVNHVLELESLEYTLEC